MKNVKLASRYAKALFDFSIGEKQLENVFQDLQALKQVVTENHEFSSILRSPIIHANKKNGVFKTVFENRVSNITLGFFGILVKKKREPNILTIIEEFFKLYKNHHHIKTAHITTAVDMSVEIKQQITDLLTRQTGAQIELVEHINPKIIGGLKIQIDDEIFDSTIKGKIDQLKAIFSKNNYQVTF